MILLDHAESGYSWSSVVAMRAWNYALSTRIECWVVLVESAIIGANERIRSQAEKEMEDAS